MKKKDLKIMVWISLFWAVAVVATEQPTQLITSENLVIV